MVSCGALTRRGVPCRNRPRSGLERCYLHAGLPDELEATALATVVEAAGSDWRAAAWLLERRQPGLYARPSRRGDVEVKPEPAAAPPDALDELERRRATRRADW